MAVTQERGNESENLCIPLHLCAFDFSCPRIIPVTQNFRTQFSPRQRQNNPLDRALPSRLLRRFEWHNIGNLSAFLINSQRIAMLYPFQQFHGTLRQSIPRNLTHDFPLFFKTVPSPKVQSRSNASAYCLSSSGHRGSDAERWNQERIRRTRNGHIQFFGCLERISSAISPKKARMAVKNSAGLPLQSNRYWCANLFRAYEGSLPSFSTSNS